MQNVVIGTEVQDNTPKGLNSAYNNITKWFDKASNKAIVNASVKFNDSNLTQYINNFTSALDKGLKRKMKAFSFEGMFYTKGGKESGPWRSINFSADELKNMNYDTAKTKLSQLVELRDRLINGTAVPASDWTVKETNKLNTLISLLSQATSNYELMLRVRSKQNTVDTTAATKTAAQTEREVKATKELVRLNEQLKMAKNDRHTAWASNDLEKQVSANRNLADLYRKRYALTKDIKDLEAAIRHEVASSSFSARLAYEREITNQKKRQLEYERIFTTQANKSNVSLAARSVVIRNIMSMMRRYISLFTLIDISKKMAEVSGFFEQQEVAIEGILGSAARARSAINEITSLALKSPFQTKDLITYTKQLSAFGVDENLIGTMKELADISAGLGVDMNRIILAYGQVKSATVLRGQELRQFTEAGVPMVKELAEKFTELNGKLVTTNEIFKLISERKVPFEMVAEVLREMTAEGGKFHEMQERLTDTLYGQIQKLKDVWTLALKNSGEGVGGVLMGIVKALQSAIQHLPAIIASASGLAILSGINGFAMLLPKIKKYLLDAKMDWKMIGDEIHNANVRTRQQVGLLNKMKVAAKGVGSALWAMRNIVGIVGSVALGFIMDAINKSREWNKTLEDINTSFNKDTSKLTSGLDRLIGKLSVASESSKEYSDALKTLKANYGEYVNDNVIDALVAEAKAAGNAAESWGQLADSIKKSIENKKQFERLNTIADEATYKIFEELKKGNNQWLFNNITYDEKKFRGDYSDGRSTQVVASVFGLDIQKKIAQATEDAAAAFLSEVRSGKHLERNSETGRISGIQSEGLKNILQEKAIQWGFNNRQADAISDSWEQVFDRLSNNDGYKEFLNSVIALDNSFENIVQRKFESTRKTFDDEYRSLVGDDKSSTFNPFAAGSREQQLFTDALHDLVYEQLTTSQLKELSKKGYADALQMEGGDFKKGSAMLNAINEFVKTLPKNESNLIYRLKHITSAYENAIGTMTDDAARIRNNAAKYIGFNVSTLSNDDKKLIQKYTNVTDQNLYQKRDELISEIESLRQKIDGILKEEGANFQENRQKYQDTIDILKILLGGKYFSVNLSSVKGASETLPPELTDVLNSIKTAYTRYKEVTQKGGIGIGLDYVKKNEYFQKNFGAFFNGSEGKQFESIASLKIGDKTAGDILKESFVTSGAENGILDFKSALSKLQKELESYGKADEKHRKAYLNAARELEKWINETFSKDNLSATLHQLDRELKQLTNTFDKTNKAVDLYRQLQKNGTLGTLGANLGVTRETALLPKSAIQRLQARDYIQLYNQTLPEEAMKFELGDISTINGVYNALGKLEKIIMLNNNAFGVEGIGSQVGKNAQELLKKLLETLIEEAKSISGEVYTGDAMEDLVANATKRTATRMDDLVAQQNVARGLKTYDYGAIKDIVKANQEEAKGIFDQFMKDSRLDIIAKSNDGKIDTEQLNNLETKLINIANGFPELLKKELLSKLKDLRDAVMDYNAKLAAPGSISQSLKNYRNAGDDAKNMFEEESKNYKNIQLQIPLAKSGIINANVDDLEAQLAASKERLDAMGGSAKVLEERLKQLAIENLQKTLQGTQDDFNAINDAANSVISCFKAMSSTINKVYSALNAGETPEWMEDMDSFLSEFGDMFNSLVAPIMAVITAVISLTAACVALEIAAWPLLAIMAALMLIAGAFAVVKMAIEKHDNDLQEGIDELEKQITATENAMKNLNATANRMTGIDKLNKQSEANAKNLELYRDSLKQAELEADKKDSDDEKVADYKQKAQEYHDAFLDGIKSTFDEITGTVESYADAISSAMRNAFQNGTNAAIAMKDAVKTSLGDMVENLMKTMFLMPQLEKAMEQLLGGNEEDYEKRFTKSDGSYDYEGAMDYIISRTNNEENVKNFQKSLYTISEGYVDMYESMPDILKDALTHLSGTSSTSGGISSIAEDTARSLEGIGNSQLMQLVISNQQLSNLSDYLFAAIQISWFNDMLQQTNATRQATEQIKQILDDTRSGARYLKVEVV